MLTRGAGAKVVLVGVVVFGGELVMSGRTSSAYIDIHVPVEVKSDDTIPADTILPVQLETTINVNEAPSGKVIEARIMQDVPLPDREKLRARSVVKGSIVSAGSDTEDPGVKITLKFDQVEERSEILHMTTYLRAIASARAVRAAQLPHSGADVGSPSGWADTVLIGGDVRYGDGGAVRDKAKEKVGKGVIGGVLVRVRANPARGCDGPVNGKDRLQALSVFSSGACGTYDLEGVKIARFGRGTPAGEITLHFDKNVTKLEIGTAMLLCIASR